MAIGAVIEYVGLKYDLWTYPEKGFEVAIYQIVVMWGATGLYFRRLLGPWLSKTDRIHSTFYRSHEVIHPLVAKEFQLASEKMEKDEISEAFKIFETIEMYCRKNLISLNYEFYTKYSQAALAEGHLRKAIELSREILPLTTNSAEKAFVYLQLCRLYRMMILMKNARLELKRAFEELELDFPTNSIFQTISVLIEYAMTLVRNTSPEIEKKLQVRNALQLKVALYEEAGLSSYYFREFMPLIQCGLKPKSIAMRLGPSIQLMNWYGGFGCVLAVLKMHGQANALIDKALQIGKNLDGVYGKSKAKLWHALALDYKGDPQGTAEELNSLLVSESGLSAFDLRLASATLACNLLIRGQMQKSKQAIDLILSEKQNSNLSLFSEKRTFVEWYKIPALSFLGETQELESIIKNSQAIFSSVDEEKWQISQFLGGLLMYHYVQGKNANQDEIRDCIKRFESLDLSPRFTFLEASYFWVAKSHLMLELAFNQQISIAEAAKAVSELGQAPKHPSIRAHWFVAQAKLLLLNNQINKSEIFLEKAVSLGKRFENYWVEYEVLNYYSKRTQTAQPENKDQEEIHKFCELHGWKGLLR